MTFRTMLGVVCVSVAAAATTWSPALAGTLSLTQTISGSSGTLSGVDIALNIPDFQTSLGTLTGLSLTFTGLLSDQAVFEGGAPGGTFTAFNNAELAGAGFPSSTLHALTNSIFTISAGQTTVFAPSVGVAFAASVPSSAFSQYTTGLPPGFELADLFFGFRLKDSSGHIIGASDAESTFNGQVVETYTYTPVPEPGTALISAMGVLALCVARRRLVQPL